MSFKLGYYFLRKQAHAGTAIVIAGWSWILRMIKVPVRSTLLSS